MLIPTPQPHDHAPPSSQTLGRSSFVRMLLEQRGIYTDTRAKQLSRDHTSLHDVGVNQRFQATLIRNEKQQGTDKSKTHHRLTFQLPDHGTPPMRPGDTIKIVHYNSPKLATESLRYLREKDQLICTKEDAGSAAIYRCRYILPAENALIHHVNFRNITKELLERTHLRIQENHPVSSNASAALTAMLHDDDACTSCLQHYHLLDFLRAFPHILTVQDVVDCMLPIRHRTYTPFHIDLTKQQISVNVSLVQYPHDFQPLFGETTTTHTPHRFGSCSSQLCQSQTGSNHMMYVKYNKMALNYQTLLASQQRHAMLMIGPGTGISPYITMLNANRDHRHQLGPTWLLTGGRYQPDLACAPEVAELISQKLLNRFDYAASREEASPKQYVTDIIRRESAAIWKFVDQEKAHIFIYGDQQVADDVHALLKEIAMREGHLSTKEAERWLQHATEQHVITSSCSQSWRR